MTQQESLLQVQQEAEELRLLCLLIFYAVVAHRCALSENQSVVLGNLADFFECAFLIPFEVDHVEHLTCVGRMSKGIIRESAQKVSIIF